MAEGGTRRKKQDEEEKEEEEEQKKKTTRMKISVFWIAFTNVDDENKQMNARPTVIIFIYVGSARARASERGTGKRGERKKSE